jgi:hypothetical protein
MNEHLFQVILLVAGALVGAIVSEVRSSIKGARRDADRRLRAAEREAKEEGARAIALQEMAKSIGKLELRAGELEEDIHGVAEMARGRFEKLEKKDTALETFVTGKMPRVSGESGAVGTRG